LGCTTNTFAGSRQSGSSSVLYGMCVAEDIDGVGDEGSGDVTTVDVQSLLEAFLSMSLRCGCFIDVAVSGKK